MSELQDHDGGPMETYFLPPLSPAFLHQLDLLQLNLTDVYETRYQLSRMSAVVVLVLPAVAELDDPRPALEVAQAVHVNLLGFWHKLEVYALHDEIGLAGSTERDRNSAQQLLKACQAKGVEVRWQGDEKLDDTSWWLIDEEVLEWAKEVKPKAQK
ncbi:hypothetical protein JCM8547_007000 [Rhodosporidiobolus lusitaniae]